MSGFYLAHLSYALCAESHLSVANSNIYNNSSAQQDGAPAPASAPALAAPTISIRVAAEVPGLASTWLGLAHVISGNLLLGFACNLFMAHVAVVVAVALAGCC